MIGEKGELWLAKNQDDPPDKIKVGWIWSKHFARLADWIHLLHTVTANFYDFFSQTIDSTCSMAFRTGQRAPHPKREKEITVARHSFFFSLIGMRAYVRRFWGKGHSVFLRYHMFIEEISLICFSRRSLSAWSCTLGGWMDPSFFFIKWMSIGSRVDWCLFLEGEVGGGLVWFPR